MSILVDWQIRDLCMGDNPLLSPFIEGTQGNGIISMGCSHAGYDLRLGRKVLIFKNTHNVIIDPKMMKQDKAYQSKIFDEIDDLKDGERVIIPPNSYILGYSLEYIRMPDWIKGTCVGKSSLARCGVLVNTTPIENGWHGYLTLEIANVTPCPVAIYVAEGIAQLEFHRLDAKSETTYAQKGGSGGKYQAQKAEPVPAKVVE